MLKKILAIVIVLCFILTGCSPTNSNISQSTSGSAPKSADPVNSTQASTSSGNSTSRRGDDVILIGVSTPLTGLAAQIGEMFQNGLIVAAEIANENGGINGKKIEYIVYDDQASPEGSLKAITRLVEQDKVDGLMNFNGTNVLSTAHIAQAAGLPMAHASSNPLMKGTEYDILIQGTGDAGFNQETLVRTMVEEVGAKRVAIISSGTDFGQSLSKTGHNALKDYTIEIVADEIYQGGDTDFTGQLAKMIAGNPDAMLFNGISSEIPIFLKQARQMGYTGYIYNAEGGANNDAMDIAGDAATNLIFSAACILPRDIKDSMNDEMTVALERYVNKFGEMPPNECYFRGYDAAVLLFEVLRTAPDITSHEDIANAILGIKGFKGTHGVYDFSAGKGVGLVKSSIFIIKDGKPVPFDKSKLPF